MRAFVATLLFFAIASALPAQVRLTEGAAEKLLVDKGEVVYPSLAKQTKLQGTVKVEIVVSETGSIRSTKIISGHPLLVAAALDSLKRRRYGPYVVQEKPLPFITTTDIVFSLGIPEKEYAAREAQNRNYILEEDKCRNLLQRREWKQAEEVCRAAVTLANRLSDEQGLTKMGAYENVGHAFLAQQRYTEALEWYSQALSLAQVSLKETDAELAYAYRNLGMANHGLRNLSRSLQLYKKAEVTLRRARENIQSPDLKLPYESALTEIEQYHLLAAQEAGDAAEIQDIKRRLEAK